MGCPCHCTDWLPDFFPCSGTVPHLRGCLSIFAKLSLLQQLYLDGKSHVNCILLEVYYHSTPLSWTDHSETLRFGFDTYIDLSLSTNLLQLRQDASCCRFLTAGQRVRSGTSDRDKLRSRLGERSLRLDECSRWQGLLHPRWLRSRGQVLGGGREIDDSWGFPWPWGYPNSWLVL